MHESSLASPSSSRKRAGVAPSPTAVGTPRLAHGTREPLIHSVLASGGTSLGRARKVRSPGCGCRGLRARDDGTVAHYLPGAAPIRRQVPGESPNGGFGGTSPAAADVPPQTWLEEHLVADPPVL